MTTNLSQTFRQDKPPPGEAAATAARLAVVPGVQAVAFVHEAPRELMPELGPGWYPTSLALCADIARTPAFGRCAAGAEVAWVYNSLTGHNGSVEDWPAAPVDAATLAGLPLETVVVGTDGSAAGLERARTAIEAVYPRRYSPSTEAEWIQDQSRTINQWTQLANVAILASLVIAGCSLAVSVAGGINERKRPFSLLRLTGVPLGVLRRVVAAESAVPLLAAAAVAIGMGFLAAHLFLQAQMQYALHLPGPAYFGLVAVGLAACLGIIGSTLPLLRRITGPETARNE
jgi:hypothetical protein